MLKRILFVSCLTLAFAARADEAFNLTAAVREAQAAGECSAPTITGVGHDSYPCTRAFDGVTHSDDHVTCRWLSPSGTPVTDVYAQYVVPTDFRQGELFKLESYRITRMYDGTYDNPRTPTQWKILGVLPDGTTEEIVEGGNSWSYEDTDAARLKTVAVTTCEAKYRGFKFRPMATTSSDSVKFGLVEVEFFVTSVGGNGLWIACAPDGTTDGFMPAIGEFIKTNATCTAPESIMVGAFPYQRLGYKLETKNGEEWTGGDVTNAAASYINDGSESGTRRLTWCYGPKAYYNLAKTIRDDGFTVSASGTKHDAYSVANIFDGVTHSSDPGSSEGKNLRWLSLTNGNPYARLDVDPLFRPRFDLHPIAYRVWRLYDTDLGYKRTPTDWTLKGVSADGSVTNLLSSVSGQVWKSGSEDSQRCASFALSANDENYRSFIFEPSAYKDTDGYTGLFELEIFVMDEAQEGNSLEIATSEDYAFSCNPVVGTQLDAATTCTRTSKGFFDHCRYAPAGYKLYRYEDDGWTVIASDPTADTYVWDGTGGILKLEWQWGAVDGCEFSVSTFGGETFDLSTQPDADGYYDVGTTVTVTTHGQTDPVSTFDSWAGTGVPPGSEKTSPLELTIGEPVLIRGDFIRHWKHVPDEGQSVVGVITDGNWSLRVASDTAAPIGDYVADILLPAGAYLAGQGELDFRLLSSDIGHAVSRVAENAMTNRVGMTGLRLAPGLGRLEKMAFAFSPDMTFVEMPDSVVQLDDGSNGNGDGGAFGHCASLECVTLSANLVYLGHQSFGSCSNLVSITPFLPASLETLGSAFQKCTSITNLPDFTHVRNLVNGCFNGCSSLAGHVALTNGQTCTSSYAGPFEGTAINSARICSIARQMFKDCRSLTNVSCTAGFTSIPYQAFNTCTALASLSADDDFSDLETIGEYAFQKCVNSKFTLPSRFPSVTSIGQYAFNLTNLGGDGTICFPSVANFDNNAFFAAGIKCVDFRKAQFTEVAPWSIAKDKWNTPYVHTIILPPTAISLGAGSFAQCSGERYIYFTGLPPTSVHEESFFEVPSYGKLFICVPTDATKLAAWRADPEFVALDDIEDKESKDNWDLVKDKSSLIGTWREFWCFARNPPAGCVVIFR